MAATHFALSFVKISASGGCPSHSCANVPACTRMYPLRPSASLSFHRVLEHVPQNEIVEVGPCPESKTNCRGNPTKRRDLDGMVIFVEYAVPVRRLQLVQWQRSYSSQNDKETIRAFSETWTHFLNWYTGELKCYLAAQTTPLGHLDAFRSKLGQIIFFRRYKVCEGKHLHGSCFAPRPRACSDATLSAHG